MSKNIIIGLVLAVIWASSLALFGKHQYDMGVQITESAWNKKENDELKAANAEIVKLRDALVKAEAEKATALAEVTKTYQEKEKDAQDQYQKNLMDLRARLLRMYDPGTRSTDASGQYAASATSTTHGSDGTTYSELSREAGEFLLSLTAEADSVTRQLGLCQSTIATYLIPVSGT